MTWFNIFLYYNEERTCCHKLLSPLILLFYPFWIVPITLGLGLYGGLRVVSWYWDSWIQEISNPDCGFMAWICTKMNLPDCAPYQVVLLSAEESPNHPQHVWLEIINCFHFEFLITTLCSKYVQKVQRCMSSSSAYLSWKIGNILQWFQFSNSSELKLKYVSDSLSMKFDINDQVLHFSSQNNNNKTMKRASIFDISWSPSCPPFCYIFYYQKKLLQILHYYWLTLYWNYFIFSLKT